MTVDATDEEQKETRLSSKRVLNLIKNYWAALGYEVEVAIQRTPTRGWFVVSNMINGYPPDWTGSRKPL